ncbi:hypothetical protein [Nitrosomonas sp.]|uniref:hypothetical protein n=1 Tax=Nitrosomonas sp. TaxID=42353 RepID=UPI001D3B7BD8|nr:hypothetical protein [Nitrosomonas sp.]MCB1948173.1 hypothetical protein [Nitrosomonas sp.]
MGSPQPTKNITGKAVANKEFFIFKIYDKLALLNSFSVFQTTKNQNLLPDSNNTVQCRIQIKNCSVHILNLGGLQSEMAEGSASVP